MKRISELPEPYRSLAEKRRDIASKDSFLPDSDFLSFAFVWYADPVTNHLDRKGFRFWSQVYRAETESELPSIPEVT